jgi:hypothetical protein
MGSKLKTMSLIVVLNVTACVLPFVAYYGYAKLTYPAYFCRPFGVVDDEIGWVLAPNVSSCIGGWDPFSRTSWFEASVFTDTNGFRAARPGTQTPRGGLLVVGDSWTFGFGVTFEGSYPGQLQRPSMPVVVAASPAYGSAQALMLAERWLDRLAPRAIVYLDLGLWQRSACRGSSRPTAILKPCYWQGPGATAAELVVPPPGRVASFAGWSVEPGGMLGAGEATWGYFLVSRPVALVYEALARVGWVAGFGDDFRPVGVDEVAIQRGTIAHLGRLAAKARVPSLLIDPGDTYAQLLKELPAEQAGNIVRVDSATWRQAVGEPASKLPPELESVPHDGHFGPGTNALIAKLVRERLEALRVSLKTE